MTAAKLSAEDLPIHHEDSYLMAIPTSEGLLVHPGAAHGTGTLVGMLLASGRPF